MKQIGFYHPYRGYWETTGWPAEKYLSEYPKGWRQVPAKPGENYKFDPDMGSWSPIAPMVARDAVNIERDRRNSLDLSFKGSDFQVNHASRDKISRATCLALAVVMTGAQEGDLRWHGQDDDFHWIAADDTRVPMDAQTVIAFSKAISERERRLVMAANALKAMETIPTDYATNENYWT